MTTISSAQHLRRRRRGLRLLGVLVTLAILGWGCGDADTDSESEEPFVDTYDSYFASFSYDYNPSPNPTDLAARSEVVAKATLVDVEDGRFFGASETEPEGVTLNLVFETTGEQRYYVQLTRPMDSTVEQLRAVLPIGSSSVVYLMPNTDPLDEGWFNVREDGNEWFFTTPQGWILEHPERGIVFPLEDNEDEPAFAESPQATRLDDWLVTEKG